jgi:hypothetical protein
MSAKNIVQYYLDSTKSDLIKNYERLGLRASGRYAKGLEVAVKDSGKKIRASITSEGHVHFMQYGRSANKQQTAKQARSLGKILEQWVKDKGIDVNPYAAAWKIVREGIKVPGKHNAGGVVTDVINDEWEQRLYDKLGSFYLQDIKAVVNKEFQYK